MPRKYKPVVGITKHKKYSENTLKSALNAIAAGCSQRKAAFLFKIPQATISNLICETHPRRPGGQMIFSDEEEIVMAKNIAVMGDWGFPVDILEIRMLLASYLQKRGRIIPMFKNNIPGKDWVLGFLKRRRGIISDRMCRNITHKRASVSPTAIDEYFHHLETSLAGVPQENIINFDETNLSDDPGQKKCVFRRGCKYPERIMNTSKASTSVMFACSATGKMLHPYVVYKAEHLHDRWIEGGPLHARYNRSRSGWFDHNCFADWFDTVVVPFCRRLPGKKVIMGDNLSSHFSHYVIEKCVAMNIAFVCLPPHSTAVCQPLDVSVFASLKKFWRQVLTEWKLNEGRCFSVMPKEWFPRLLSRLTNAMAPTQKENVISGFRKCDIFPLDKTAVASRLHLSPAEVLQESGAIVNAVSDAVLHKLELIHQSLRGEAKPRKKRINVIPGKSISLSDFQPVETAGCDEEDDENDDLDSETGELPLPPPLKRRIAMSKEQQEPSSSNSTRIDIREIHDSEPDKRTRSGRSSLVPPRYQ